MSYHDEQLVQEEITTLLKSSLKNVGYVELWKMKDRLYELSKIIEDRNRRKTVRAIDKRIKAIDKQIAKRFSNEGDNEYIKKKWRK